MGVRCGIRVGRRWKTERWCSIKFPIVFRGRIGFQWGRNWNCYKVHGETVEIAQRYPDDIDMHFRRNGTKGLATDNEASTSCREINLPSLSPSRHGHNRVRYFRKGLFNGVLSQTNRKNGKSVSVRQKRNTVDGTVCCHRVSREKIFNSCISGNGREKRRLSIEFLYL